MTDAAQVQDEKRFGRNQKIAVAGYALPLLMTFAGCIAAALKGGDAATALASLDKWIAFAQIYVPVAMGSILLVSGAVKGIQALSARHQQ